MPGKRAEVDAIDVIALALDVDNGFFVLIREKFVCRNLE